MVVLLLSVIFSASPAAGRTGEAALAVDRSLSSQDGTAAGAILAEVRRLQAVLAALPLPAAEQQSVSSLLSRSERAAQAERVYLRLHILQYAATTLAGYAHM